ncbi:hypothetical protein AB1E18_008832 [Capra hircus]
MKRRDTAAEQFWDRECPKVEILSPRIYGGIQKVPLSVLYIRAAAESKGGSDLMKFMDMNVSFNDQIKQLYKTSVTTILWMDLLGPRASMSMPFEALLVAKLFSKMACVLAKMDEAVFPTLDDIVKALDHQTSKHYPSTHGLTYTVLPSRVKNLAQFGAPIKDMCRAFPTYFAQQQKEGT